MHTPSTPPSAPVHPRRRQHPLLLIAAIAVILFCAVGTAAIMGWLPTSKGRNQLTDADRAALAAGLQQPGAPVQAAYPAGPAPLTPSAQPLATAPQALAAPAYPGGADQYGASGSAGATASGYAPAPLPAEPVPEARLPAPAPASRVVQSDDGSRWCGTCGNVESVRTITTRAHASGVGAAGGAILGGLLGNQIGSGHGRQLATVAGAMGGAVVGNQVEGNMNASRSYEIRVRLDDGTLRTFHQQHAPRWRSGDRVRLVKGSLRSA